jgi:hypothetical protein
MEETMTNGNDPAYGNPERYSDSDKEKFTGLTKRELFALHAPRSSKEDYAMVVEIALVQNASYPTFREWEARQSILWADALLAALNKQENVK